MKRPQIVSSAPSSPSASWLRDPSVIAPAAVLLALALAAVFAPFLGTIDPLSFDPISRNLAPGATGVMRLSDGSDRPFVFMMGTDSLGRDIYSRVLFGARISLLVGASVALAATILGTLIGVLAGYIRALDALLMRLMDGFMAIPPILLAIALASLSQAGLAAVITAIAAPEIPRVARLVRSLVLSIREEPYVEAAVTAGTQPGVIMIRHILPNCIAPLIVQASFVCASAILAEAALSFLGVGLPAQTPSWGNIMAQGRQFFRLYPHNIFFPGLFVFMTVLCVNLLGDALRDRLDPKLRKRF